MDEDTREALKEVTEQMLLGVEAVKTMIQTIAQDKEYHKALAQFAMNMKTAYIEAGFTKSESIALVIGNIAKLNEKGK